MVIGIIGENCTGKSTLAEYIRDSLQAQIITGKDYLRMTGSEQEAKKLFQEKLKSTVSGEHMIYVVSGPDQLAPLPEKSVRILVSCDLETIKERFRARMHGTLPAAVERMLERRHGIFDHPACDYHYDGVNNDAAALCAQLQGLH